MSNISEQPQSPAGSHQLKSLLTTALPSTGARSPTSDASSSLQWCKRLLRSRIVRFLGCVYILVSAIVFTLHLGRRYSGYGSVTPAGETIELAMPASLPSSSSPLSLPSQQLRLSKMFSKSLFSMKHVRPYWASASITPPEDALTLVTVVDMDDVEHLYHLVEVWQGPISATLFVTTDGSDFGSGAMIQHYSTIRRAYQSNALLSRHVDLHIIGRPESMHGGIQEARNMARLLSRTRYVAYVPATVLWMTDLNKAAASYVERLDQGDILIVPTFAFPKKKQAVTDAWPTNKNDMVSWVDEGKIGLLDYHWPLNEGPTSFNHWRDATEPYPLPHYDYHYGPVYIATRDNHPWCEERFADEASACLYSTYLNGADLLVLPDDYAVRTGQEPENKLSQEERVMQVKLYKNYRIEQCVFFARQFDQTKVFHTDRGKHVQEECAKELRSLRMLSPHNKRTHLHTA